MNTTPLSKGTVANYAAAVGPVAILGMPLSVFLPPFVTDGGVIAVGLVGLLFMLTTIWDGIVDPAIGGLVDRSSNKNAPHRYWMWLAAVPMAFALALIVFAGDTLSFLPLFLLVILFTSAYSLFDVAHLAWGSALARNKEESSRLFGGREWASKMFLLAAFAAPAVAQAFIPGLKNDGRVMAYAVVAIAFLPLALWATTRLPARPIVPEPGLGWRQEWRTTFRFPALLLLLLAEFLNTFGLGAITSLFLFFADGALGLGEAAPLLLLLSFVGGALLTPVWTKLAVRFGKPVGMQMTSVWMIIFLLSALTLPKGSFLFAALFALSIGTGFVGLLFVYGMAADLVPVDRQRCGRDRTGFIFALANIAQKSGTAVGIGVSYALLGWFGFDSKNAAASADLLRTLYIGLPIIAWAGVIVTLQFLQKTSDIHRNTPLQKA
ncbi:MAG: MFS transporter [Sphingorhabdus sp.]